jgi:HK97 family phage major capsid protein/HK97 family phage prohead protease
MSELKIGSLSRDFEAVEITVQTREAGSSGLSFPASSEAPVERWFGKEILSHDPKAIRMDRMNKGAAPLLFNHNWDDPIGMVDAAAVRDKRMWVDAHLFDTPRAKEVGSMIAGGLRNVSIGYELHELEEDKKGGTFTARDWSVHEVSLVTVPADAGVGIGRTKPEEEKAVRVTRAAEVSTPAAPAASERKATMAENQTVAGAPAADPSIQVTADYSTRQSPVQLEAERKKGIQNLCKANRLDERFERSWIEQGSSLGEVSEQLLTIMEERGKTNPQAVTKLDMGAADVRKYSLMRALRAATSKDWSKAGLELEANREIVKRLNRLPKSDTSFFVPLDIMMRDRQQPARLTRDWDVAGTNGSNYLVSTDNQPGSFIELLRNTSVGLRAGVRRLSGLQGNVTIPKMTAGTTAYWLADETTAITEANPTLGQVSLTPKNVAALTELSHLLMQQSSPDAEQLIMDSIARDIALAVDVGIIRGSGNTGQPHGIVGTAGLGSVSGTSLAAAGILEFQSDVAAANGINSSFSYVTTPAVAALLMARPELPTTGTTRMWTGNILNGAMLGFPAFSSAQMTAATMLAGSWDTVILAEWGVLELMVNPFSDFTRGLTAVRGWYTCDVAMRYPGSFSYGSSIT